MVIDYIDYINIWYVKIIEKEYMIMIIYPEGVSVYCIFEYGPKWKIQVLKSFGCVVKN